MDRYGVRYAVISTEYPTREDGNDLPFTSDTNSRRRCFSGENRLHYAGACRQPANHRCTLPGRWVRGGFDACITELVPVFFGYGHRPLAALVYAQIIRRPTGRAVSMADQGQWQYAFR